MKHYDLVGVVTNEVTFDRRMIRTCETLSNKGLRILLIGRSIDDREYEDLYDFDVHRVTCKNNRGPFFYYEFIQVTNTFLRDISYNYLLLTDYDTLLLAKKERKNVKKIYLDLHEYFEHTPELKGRPIKKWIWQTIADRYHHYCDVIYTVNESLASLYSKRLQRKVDVIMNVPVLNKTLAMADHSNKIIRTVYLGALNPGRGLEALISAALKFKGFALRIIGDGPIRSKLEDLAEGAENIEFLGMLKREKLSQVLVDRDIGWNLLDPSSQSYYYSLANKFFDYANHDLGVITMRFPEYERILSKHTCGMMLESIDESAIIEAMKMVISTPVIIDQWKKESSQLKKEYNWALESQKLLTLYEDLVIK